ncbi:MAG TPA: LLM class flavin-dependent oxidoreductase [Stellaceae bacterium]|nr:LLM class flavin-dependent oxidoreductase [Stellaceae bacterium]
MKLSILSVADHYPDRARTTGEFYRALVDQAVLAESLGYEICFIAEHHFHPYGAVPNPAVLLSAIAERTTRIRLGPAITVLPFRDPRTVAEDYALLDQLSRGRLVLGLGSGYLRHEFAGFGRDPAEKRDRFDENMTIVKRLLSGERVSFAGRFTALDAVQLNVTPVQREVPIFVAALNNEAVYHIGRQGNGLLTIPYGTLGHFDEIGALAAAFARGRQEAGAAPLPHGIAPHIATFHTYVARSDEEAEALVREAFELYCRTRLYAKPWTYEQIRGNGLALFGSVASVAEKLIALYRMGVEHVATMSNFGALDAERVAASMRLMMDEVMPIVHKATGT